MMEIGEHMKRDIVAIEASTTVGEAAASFVANGIGTMPVIDSDGRLVGVLHLRDLIELVMPAFVRLIEDFDFVSDFGILEERLPAPEVMAQPVSNVMEEPVSVRASSGLLRAFSIIHSHNLIDLLVVDDERKLVGLASRADIGNALLSGWQLDANQ
jgi:CBS-domain-containing membrane protein